MMLLNWVLQQTANLIVNGRIEVMITIWRF
jgi:hypothetical protein